MVVLLHALIAQNGLTRLPTMAKFNSVETDLHIVW